MAFNDAIKSKIYSEIYSYINNFLSSKAGKGAVIYSLEPNPNGDLLQKMIRNGLPNAVQYIHQNALTIIDRDLFYQPIDEESSMTLASELYSSIVKLNNSHGYDKFLLFCIAEKLSERGTLASSMIFEQQLNSNFHLNILKDKMQHNAVEKVVEDNNNVSIETVCVYKKKFLEERDLNDLIKLVTYHSQTLRYRQMGHRTLDGHKIIECISRGFEEVLGEDSSRLFFATLKLIYQIDGERIISDPDAFFEKLNKMIGKNAASVVIPTITHHIISEML